MVILIHQGPECGYHSQIIVRVVLYYQKNRLYVQILISLICIYIYTHIHILYNIYIYIHNYLYTYMEDES